MYYMFQAFCKGEVNKCHNGGIMIWDPVKPFTCLCNGVYEGEFCEKGNTGMMQVPVIVCRSNQISLNALNNSQRNVCLFLNLHSHI